MTTIHDLNRAVEAVGEVPCMNAPDFFFVDRNEPGQIKGYHIAKKLCAECPIKWTCLDYALENDEQEGMWGGLSPYERQATRRKKVV